MPSTRLLFPLLLLAACGPFEPDPTGPGGGGPGDGAPEYALPFRLGSLQDEEIRAVVAQDDEVVVTGWFSGTLDFDPGDGSVGRTSQGGQDIFVARYRNDGAFISLAVLGGTGADVPHAMATMPDGGVVVVGYGSGGGLCGGSVLAGQGGRDVLLARFTADGTCVFARLIGGPGDDEARAVAVDGDGSIVVTGHFSGTADLAPGGETAVLQSRGGNDAFLARYSPDGVLLAVAQGGGVDDDLFQTLMISADGDITVAGEFRGSASYGSALGPVVLQSTGGADIVLARYTALLGLRWAIRAGGPDQDRAVAIADAGNGAVIATGTFEGTADLDPGAGAALVVSRGAADVFLARYRADNGSWDGLATAFGGAGSEGVSRIQRHSTGMLLVSGWFQESVDFDPGPGATVRVARASGGGGDAFLAGYAANGAFRWVTPVGASIGGAGQIAIGFGLAEDPVGTVWLGGRFFGRADFDPGEQAVELLATGSSDAFLARYSHHDGALLAIERED